MANKMLIDASHQEETRVVVVRGNRIEEFDFESEHKKQIRGNIYLARVTRVEPSLQAAFVEYGGNRHGFLAFSEIHPDYYQIPFADRQALLEAEAAEHDEQDEDDEITSEDASENKRDNKRNRRRDNAPSAQEASENSEDDNGSSESEQAGSDDEQHSDSSDEDNNQDADGDDDKPTIMEMAVEEDAISEEVTADVEAEPVSERPRRNDRNRRSRKSDNGDDEHSDDGHIEEQEVIESVGAEDAMEEVPMRKRTSRRQYKIQEVIKRRQVLLVQVVKEERGNKGAALTTYLSLAGRYSVLMPNTGRGGGISRKITSIQDRKRLKDVVKELDVPQGMGVILRTAGANRTKVEIKRDYEYLMRAWETVRNLTLQSSAPALVYEEGSLIKRSIRDLYNKDIGEIIVAGENGYREAKDFMRMLMPSHAKMVQPYREITPIFARAGIEAQLDRMLQPQVTLKSGGYIIINQTEALVSIDVNSGRSTREHSIEDTALQTNLEAAEEVARQLRLRDLAGLVVIDFIDMEEKRNNRSVEKRLKDHLKNDRARIQVGRISHFGL
ncbi:MAG: Rne/Rng family ribonuclease, partial [Rhizobiaceae bacterium]